MVSMQMRGWITLLCVLASCLLGVYVGYIDLHEEDVQGPVLILLGSAFLVGAVQPARAWVFAAIIGGSIPLAHLYASAAGMNLPYETFLLSTLLAFIPAFLGAAAGAAMGKAAQILRS
jgi:hypothetical protein